MTGCTFGLSGFTWRAVCSEHKLHFLEVHHQNAVLSSTNSTIFLFIGP